MKIFPLSEADNAETVIFKAGDGTWHNYRVITEINRIGQRVIRALQNTWTYLPTFSEFSSQILPICLHPFSTLSSQDRDEDWHFEFVGDCKTDLPRAVEAQTSFRVSQCTHYPTRCFLQPKNRKCYNCQWVVQEQQVLISRDMASTVCPQRPAGARTNSFRC